MFRLAYNTNGLAHHRLKEALVLLADLGYEGVAITPDVGELDPLDLRPAFVRDVRALLGDLGLDVAIETGARFVLDPSRKHRPSLLEEDAAGRERRIDFYRRSIDLARDLGGELVSIWSGTAPDGERGDAPDVEPRVFEPLWDRLASGLVPVLDHAASVGVRIGFEPEPGMFVERPSGYLELVRRLGTRGGELGLTLDVGHLLVTRDGPVPQAIRDMAPYLVHVHLDDIANGVHEHRMFGQGDLDLTGVLSALKKVAYAGMAVVELSRDSHRGAQAAEEAMRHLRAAIPNTSRPC